MCRAWDSGYATPLEAAAILATLGEGRGQARVSLSTGSLPLVTEVPGAAQWSSVEIGLGEAGARASVLYQPGSASVRIGRPRLPGIGRIGFNLSGDEENSTTPETIEPPQPAAAPCWSLDEARTYRAGPGGGIDLTLRIALTGRSDVWLALDAAADLEDALAARLKPLLPGGTIGKVAIHRMGPAHLSFETTSSLGSIPGPPTAVPLGTVFRTLPGLADIVGLEDGQATVPMDRCGQVTQTLRFEGLTAGGLVPREAAHATENPRYPIARSAWNDGAFVRTLRTEAIHIAPGDWLAVRAELGAWLQDQGRLLLLLPPGEAASE